MNDAQWSMSGNNFNWEAVASTDVVVVTLVVVCVVCLVGGVDYNTIPDLI